MTLQKVARLSGSSKASAISRMVMPWFAKWSVWSLM